MARTIANSPLVKCAMNGNDPNWGRIISAAGYAGVPFNPDKCTLTLQGTQVFAGGQPIGFDAAAVSDFWNRIWASSEPRFSNNPTVSVVAEIRLKHQFL